MKTAKWHFCDRAALAVLVEAVGHVLTDAAVVRHLEERAPHVDLPKGLFVSAWRAG